ncbi:MAG: cytochrome b/b6 domain-containing protein [Chlamydiia bacterium]|nr:cytochrome b/b6 domain-containing protein [Chlamydiia bacterium]
MASATAKVWDPLVRVFHWSLVASFAVAWLTADEVQSLHEWAGYAAAALIGFRLLYGLVGPRYARFSQFVRGPRTTVDYAADVLRRREKRYLGHNPLGALMVIALLVTMAAIATTGFMMTTDAYWGVDWVQEVHETLANLMLALVILHVLGVVFASLAHHENLVRSMITGRKRAAEAGDVA